MPTNGSQIFRELKICRKCAICHKTSWQSSKATIFQCWQERKSAQIIDNRYKRFLKMEKVSKTWKQNWGVENKCGQIIISLKKCKKMREKQFGYHVQLRTPRSREQCKLMGKSGEVHPKKWGGAPRRRRDGWQN